MGIKTIDKENGKVYCDCVHCGKEIIADYPDAEGIFAEIAIGFMRNIVCDSCKEEIEKAKAAENERQRMLYYESVFPERLAMSGIKKKFQNMPAPFVRSAAAVFYENSTANLLITGETGTCKTSSACFVAQILMKQRGLKVKYHTRKSLFQAYVSAKTANDDYSVERFYANNIDHVDLLIIDELIGKKGDTMSPSEQEFFFDLVDGVYSGDRECQLWILGNFYAGSIDKCFEDAEPLKRRLTECFVMKELLANGKVRGIAL